MRLWAFLVLVLGSERGGEGSLSLSRRPRADAGQEGRDPAGLLQNRVRATGGPGGPGLWVPCGQEETGREAFRRGSSRPSPSQAPGVSEGREGHCWLLGEPFQGRVGAWQAEALRVRRERQGAGARDMHSRGENRFALPVFVFALETHAGTQREALGEKGRPETCYKGHVDKAQSPDLAAGGSGPPVGPKV